MCIFMLQMTVSSTRRIPTCLLPVRTTWLPSRPGEQLTDRPAGLRKYVDAISHLFEHKSSRVDLLRQVELPQEAVAYFHQIAAGFFAWMIWMYRNTALRSSYNEPEHVQRLA